MGQAKRINIIAAACHEVYRAYHESEVDDSVVAWSTMSKEQQHGTLIAVKSALQGHTPAAVHDAWLEKMQENGWSYADEVNQEGKQHPLVIPYAELPSEIHVKDALFCRTVAEMAQVIRAC